MQNDPTYVALVDAIMQKVHLDDDEQRAGELVTTILGADRWVPRDVPGISGMHDLDVVTPDASRIAVEVTSHTAKSKAAFARESGRLNPISASSLRCHWQIEIDVPAIQEAVRPLLNRINGDLQAILRQVEQHELFEEVRFLPPGSTSTDGHPLCGRLRELRVVCAQAIDTRGSGRIWLYAHQGAFWFGQDDIAHAVDAHVEAKLDKLLRAKDDGAVEAHLFVWLPPGTTRSPGASAALHSGRDDDRISASIDLCGIDSVWVTSSGRQDFEEVHGHRSPVYRYDQSGWRKYTLAWEAAPG